MDNVLFSRDHLRSWPAVHLFSMQTENAQRRRGGGFTGFVRVVERFELEERCQAWEPVYRQDHDVWCTGPGLICGTHGPDCPAIDAVQYWLDSGHQTLAYYPRVTVTGDVPFLAGVCTIGGQAMLKARLE